MSSSSVSGVDTIDLSPIEESMLSKLSRVNKVDFQFGTHGPEYVKRFNGKKIRVGFRKRKKKMNAKTVKTVKTGKNGKSGRKVKSAKTAKATKRVHHPHHQSSHSSPVLNMVRSGKVEYNAVKTGNRKK